MTFLRQYLTAVQLFTRLRITGALDQWIGLRPDALHGSARHWPGVGWLVGLVACTVFALLALALPSGPYAPLVAAVACTIASAVLTGAVDEVSLSRFVQGARRGNVMPDIPLDVAPEAFDGYGALSLVLALLLKIALLAVLAGQSPTAVLAALLAGHVVSRFCPLVLMRGLPYAGDATPVDRKYLGEALDTRSLAIGALWCIVPLALALLVQPPGLALIGVIAAGMALAAMHKLLARRFKGVDADSVGAAQQVCEIAFYLGAAIGLGIA